MLTQRPVRQQRCRGPRLPISQMRGDACVFSVCDHRLARFRRRYTPLAWLMPLLQPSISAILLLRSCHFFFDASPM